MTSIEEQIEADEGNPLHESPEYPCDYCRKATGGEFLTCGCSGDSNAVHVCEECAIDGLCPLCHVDRHNSPAVVHDHRSRAWIVTYERGGEIPSRHERLFQNTRDAYLCAASEAADRCDLRSAEQACAAAYLSWLVYPDMGRAELWRVMNRFARRWDTEEAAKARSMYGTAA